MRRLVLILAAIGLVAGLAACGDDDGEGSSTTDPSSGATEPAPAETELTPEALAGRTFTSTSVEGYELVSGSSVILGFEGTDTLGANAGCNQMSSTYELDGTTLRWTGVPAATMMACDEPLMAQDTWLTELLTGGVEAALSGAELTLTGDDVTIVLAEEEVADAPIVGTAWAIESLVAGDTVSSWSISLEPATLTFTDDGTVEVFAGCNRGSGTAEISDDGATITFGPIATTKMLCSPTAMDLEAQVLRVLDGEVEASVEGDTLTLTNGNTGLTYTAS